MQGRIWYRVWNGVEKSRIKGRGWEGGVAWRGAELVKREGMRW